jgi:GNAT superfamily N-acetyltransferase
MTRQAGWRKTADRFLYGRTLGDRYALRLVPIARRWLDEQRLRRLEGSASAWLYDCGSKPWSNPVHAAVAILRAYYGREMGGEFYMDYEGEVPTYLMVMHDSGDTAWALGILCFHHFGRERLPFGDGHCFMFAWVHPLFRRQGLMQAAIKLAAADLGQFYCQTPISRGMREILRKMGHPQADDMTGMEIHGRHYC